MTLLHLCYTIIIYFSQRLFVYDRTLYITGKSMEAIKYIEINLIKHNYTVTSAYTPDNSIRRDIIRNYGIPYMKINYN